MLNLLDEKKITDRFDRAAKTYDKAAVLQRLVGKTLLKRLRGIRHQPKTILDLGCGTGYSTHLLKKLYPTATIVGLDKSKGMLDQGQKKEKSSRKINWLCGYSEALPFDNHTFELIYSNLMLHWSVDFTQSLRELHRVLAPDGLLLFSIVGPDTLKELRYCWAQVDNKPHVHCFVDMHDIGDKLVNTHFVDPIMDIDYFTLLYSEPLVLMKELKNLGVQNLISDRHKGLTAKGAFKKLLQTYETLCDSNGKLPATWEIIYGHAWTPNKMAEANMPPHYAEIAIPIHPIGNHRFGSMTKSTHPQK